jgi:hypothetical protein
MNKFALLAASALVLSTVAMANPEVAVLDGTSWKLDVKPDKMTKDKNEKDYNETLTFADGNITLGAPKVSGSASPYSVTKSGEKDVTFTAERNSSGEGNSVWTGTVHGKDIAGKMIWTKNDGSVFTYSFKGNKLD